MTRANVSIYQDKRHQKKDGNYPVKIQISRNREQKYFATGISCTEEEFNRSYLSARARGPYKALKEEIVAQENRANEIVQELVAFTFEAFKIRFKRKPSDGVNMFYYFEQKEAQCKAAEQFGSENSYRNAKSSFKEFQTFRNGSTSFMHFEDVTADYLKQYEAYMTNPPEGIKERSLSTVGVYCRNLRALFNEADAAREIDKRKVYPFGRYKGQFQIPSSRKVKKALNKEKLGAFLHAPVEPGSHQEKARDFWFFSYVANGMNPRDIAFLRYSNLSDTAISFYREKIKRTSRNSAKPVIVPLNDFLRGIIAKHGNERLSDDTFVFPILSGEMDARRQYESARNFTRYVNQHTKRLAATVGLEEEISVNWARHSFTTQSIQNGQEIEFIQDALGHKSKQTTQNYWAGFEEAHKRGNQEVLLDLPRPLFTSKINEACLRVG